MGIMPNYSNWNRRIMETKMAIAAKEVGMEAVAIEESSLNEVKGLGKSAIAKLREAGITSKSQLIKADKEVLKTLLNPVTLKQVTTFIKENEQLTDNR